MGFWFWQQAKTKGHVIEQFPDNYELIPMARNVWLCMNRLITQYILVFTVFEITRKHDDFVL